MSDHCTRRGILMETVNVVNSFTSLEQTVPVCGPSANATLALNGSVTEDGQVTGAASVAPCIPDQLMHYNVSSNTSWLSLNSGLRFPGVQVRTCTSLGCHHHFKNLFGSLSCPTPFLTRVSSCPREVALSLSLQCKHTLGADQLACALLCGTTVQDRHVCVILN